MIKRVRKMVQAGWGILTNAYIKGFLPGGPMIYEGPLKRFCVPGMNCYSCPGALGACPIGALQSALTARNRRFPFYVLGYLLAVGLLAGRFICGWLCLFGLIQELLYKIPTPKLTIPEKLDRVLRYLKYAVLAVLVIGLPLLYRSDTGVGEPFFCKFLCPVGTLEGGVPLVLGNSVLRPALGWLFRWKLVLLALCLVSCVFIYRPFCKYICPLGAFYSLFSRVSIVKISVDAKACVNCGACARACGMGVDPSRKPDSAECIRCGECIDGCPAGALSFTVRGGSSAPRRRRTKRMKKLLSVLLIFALILALAACGNRSEGAEAPKSGEQPAEEPAGQEQETDDPAPAEEKEPEEETPAEDDRPVISFETFDIDGNSVSSADIFSANDLTIINIWGTYCGPCIREMPDLAKLSERLKDKNCEIVGIVCDVAGPSDSTMIATAKEILEETGVGYLNLLPWANTFGDFPAQFIPTTYFVDSKGHIVGEALIGARSADDYEELIDAALEGLK